MSEVLATFGGMALLAAILANIAIWAPRRLRLKLAALATLAAFLPLSYVALSDLLSRPKPVALEWRQRDVLEATVVSAKAVEKEAIYLWLALEDTAEPRAYVLPWDEEMARQLHGARRNAERDGALLKIGRPFEQSLDQRDRLFYPAPPQPLPAKMQAESNPYIFRQRQSAARPE